ncbi:hematopoietic SH2 domain-containing protein homolog [Mixophyes fleayi]|uniref:hematopoietic SH2 domain-containing protein homolog n=1 Tax=Mixophyes fleayi TaxID=3061075 RepID=UPI003F4DA798
MEENKPSVKWFVETQSQWFLQNGIPEWFHGVITRKDAEDLLKGKTPGCFLVRVGESRIGYSLSYRAADRYRHFMIDVLKDQQCKLSGDTRIYGTLEDLVMFHKQCPLYPYNEFLTHPCGQKTTSATDYEELFEHTKTFATPFQNPVNTFLSTTGTSGVILKPSCPPVPPRRFQSSDAINSQMTNISHSLPPTGNRLYPLLPTQIQVSNNTVPVLPIQQRCTGMSKSNSVDSSVPNMAHNSNGQIKNGETHSNTSKKPLKACRGAMTKAVSLVTEGEIAHDFKKMETAMVAHMKNVKENLGRFGQTVQKNTHPTSQQNNHQANIPEEYKKPPPFAPGFC